MKAYLLSNKTLLKSKKSFFFHDNIRAATTFHNLDFCLHVINVCFSRTNKTFYIKVTFCYFCLVLCEKIISCYVEWSDYASTVILSLSFISPSSAPSATTITQCFYSFILATIASYSPSFPPSSNGSSGIKQISTFWFD